MIFAFQYLQLMLQAGLMRQQTHSPGVTIAKFKVKDSNVDVLFVDTLDLLVASAGRSKPGKDHSFDSPKDATYW